jgi:hypothetical protein
MRREYGMSGATQILDRIESDLGGYFGFGGKRVELRLAGQRSAGGVRPARALRTRLDAGDSVEVEVECDAPREGRVAVWLTATDVDNPASSSRSTPVFITASQRTSRLTISSDEQGVIAFGESTSATDDPPTTSADPA